VALRQLVLVGGPFFCEAQIEGKLIAVRGEVKKAAAGFQTHVSVELREPVVVDGQQDQARGWQGLASTYVLRLGEWVKAGESSRPYDSRAWFIRLSEVSEEPWQ